jgi:hypothetical protein
MSALQIHQKIHHGSIIVSIFTFFTTFVEKTYLMAMCGFWGNGNWAAGDARK